MKTSKNPGEFERGSLETIRERMMVTPGRIACKIQSLQAKTRHRMSFETMLYHINADATITKAFLSVQLTPSLLHSQATPFPQSINLHLPTPAGGYDIKYWPY